MRTKKYATRLVRLLISILIGAPLPRRGFITILSDNENSASVGLFSELPEGSLRMFGIVIQPARYWQSFSRSGLAAVCAHEIMNSKHPPTPMDLELAEKMAEIDRMYPNSDMAASKRGRRNHLRMEHELYKGLLIVVLARKLWVDYEAIKLMRERNLDLNGYIEFMEAERAEEMRQVKPIIRQVNRVMFAQIRLDHARLVISGDQESLTIAENMRRFYEQWSRSVQFAHEKSRTSDPKAPSTS